MGKLKNFFGKGIKVLNDKQKNSIKGGRDMGSSRPPTPPINIGTTTGNNGYRR